MSNLQITPIEYNSEQKTKIVLTNIIKMMTNRGLMSREKIDDNIDKFTNKDSLNNTYTMTLSEPIIDVNNPDFDGKKLNIMFVDQKITTINKSHPMINFIVQNKNTQKILVIKSINNKSKFTLKQSYPHTEIFNESDLMMDIVTWFGISEHIPLSQEEGERVLNEYRAKKKDMPKIHDTEQMACYYNLQPGQIVKIIRSSENTGFTFYYRITVKNNNIIDK
jgi:DNA-directed RNA polymerase subunit H (RpoH/RPB5)